MKHYSFPSIEQYRTVIKYVNDRCDRFAQGSPRPKLMFHGTVKLHGTNASVVAGADGTFYAQSRSQVITPQADNAGFAAFAEQQKLALVTFASMAEHKYFTSRDDYVERRPVNVVVYGEWCGGNIQSGVALSKLPKMFVIFAVRFVDVNQDAEESKSFWLMPWDVEAAFDAVAQDPTWPSTIKCIEKFQTWQLTIDFGDPKAVQNELVRITTEVEARCPVSFELGSDGVGEGVVWTCVGENSRPSSSLTPIRLDDLVFKVKGEKHSDTKVKTVAEVDIEKLNSLKELAASLVTEHRFEKGASYLKETLHTDDVFHVKNIGGFLKWIGNDVLKEDVDTIEGNGFEPREVTKAVNELAKAWFLKQVNDHA